MSNPAEAPPAGGGAVETKTSAGAIWAYVGAMLLFAILTSTETDLTPLPDWLETFLYPIIPGLVGFLGSYLRSHKPGQMSSSAYRALHRAP